MSERTESTSNSTKLAPMPMYALMANLEALKDEDNSDSSFISLEDSDDSFSAQTVSKQPSVLEKNVGFVQKQRSQSLFITTPKQAPEGSCIKNGFASEKKFVNRGSNKENCDQSLSSRTYPHKSNNINNSSKKPLYISSTRPEVNQRNVLVPLRTPNIQVTKQSFQKVTPELVKVPSSGQKLKSITPKIKTGIRKFTPGSGYRSQKKTPVKVSTETTKESARCLFPDSQISSNHPHQPLQPKEDVRAVPETPINRNPPPPTYTATPSYPQGIVGNTHSKTNLKTINIKGKNYIYIKKLGVGGSSEVYKVIEVGTSSEYAVKFVDLATDKELAQGYINEVRLLRELQNSDRVIRLYEYDYEKESQMLRVVLEVGETDLSSFLKARGSGLPPALVLHYWEEMLHAVRYIHDHGVIHADLKPANFLLVCGKLKLIDFGIASAISSDATSVVRSQATGTYSYISPEALVGGAGGYGVAPADGSAPIKISFRSDVWSLGCILYSMVYGRTPFSHIPNLAKLAAILDPNHMIQYPTADHVPPPLLSALKWCLTYNAKSRPSVRELLAIPYLPRAPLPADLLRRLTPHVTPQERELLQRALV